MIVIFSWLNVQPVTVNFGFSQVTMPLVVILVISLLLGVILAVLFSMTTILQQKQELKQVKSKLESNQAMRRADKNIKQEIKTRYKNRRKVVRCRGKILVSAKYRWQEENLAPTPASQAIADEFGLATLVAELLVKKGYTTVEEVRRFLEPSSTSFTIHIYYMICKNS